MIARLAAIIAFVLIGPERIAASDVVVRRVPNGGYKASTAVDAAGKVHLVYFTGEPAGGNAWYVTSQDGGATFSKPIRVNSQAESVLGASSSRGPRLALGKDGRVHAIWMGSAKATPPTPSKPKSDGPAQLDGSPLLYANFNPAAGAFSQQRNLITRTIHLDGDSAIAADQNGTVYVVWHAEAPGGKGEKDRGIWVAHSSDDGASFSEEKNVLPEKTGVCACCGVTAQIGKNGSIAIAYRAATEMVHRGMWLLHSENRGETFIVSALDEWKIPMCPMSTASIIDTPKGFLGAWENDGRIGLSKLPRSAGEEPPPLSGAAPRKHPTLAINKKGETLLAWVEGIRFGKGGAIGWQRFDAGGKPIGSPGHAEGLPAHGSVAALALADGTFAIIY